MSNTVVEYYINDSDGNRINVYYDTMILKPGDYYVIDSYAYKYTGVVTHADELDPGCCGLIKISDDTELVYKRHSIDDRSIFHENNIKECVLDEYSSDISIDDVISAYTNDFKTSKSIDDAIINASSGGGDVITPIINDDDDPFMVIIKTVLLTRGNVILSRYRDSFKEKHGVDNLRTTVLGATRNLSIDRFLSWCEILSLNWSITLRDNGSDSISALSSDIIVTSDDYKDIKIEPSNDTVGLFRPMYSDDDDPLKRILKCVINSKNVRLKEYANKLPTPHMLSNMCSSIKRTSKHNMSVRYFISWCEILGCDNIISVYDSEVDKTYTVYNGKLLTD